jgi:uncharacterized membrane protein YhaH (DUF805 family)
MMTQLSRALAALDVFTFDVAMTPKRLRAAARPEASAQEPALLEWVVAMLAAGYKELASPRLRARLATRRS